MFFEKALKTVYIPFTIPSIKTYKKLFVFASDRRASACREPKFLCRKPIKTYEKHINNL